MDDSTTQAWCTALAAAGVLQAQDAGSSRLPGRKGQPDGGGTPVHRFIVKHDR